MTKSEKHCARFEQLFFGTMFSKGSLLQMHHKVSVSGNALKHIQISDSSTWFLSGQDLPMITQFSKTVA